MKNIVEKLRLHEAITENESFDLAQYVSKLITITENQNFGFEIIVYVADNWNKIPSSTQEVWGELIESAGFYPYIKKLNLDSSDLAYKLRTESHHSTLLDKYLHEGQKSLLEIIFNGKNVVASAPTSFGKSLLIEEIIASRKYKNIVIIQPTLALLEETRTKLNKYRNDYKLIVRTTQTVDVHKGNIFLLTAERVMEYQSLPKIDFLILDEFYKLSNLRGDNRSNILNNAFLRVMQNQNCQFYLLGPNVDNVSKEFLQKYKAEFYHTTYTLVTTETRDMFDANKPTSSKKVNKKDLFDVLDGLNEQTLIFCSSPSTARKLAFEYAKHLKDTYHIQHETLPLVNWIDSNISWGWSLTKCLELGIGVHDGSMPKHITSSTIRYFNEKRLNYLFCTNTIIEGVNTSAKYVVLYDDHIGNRKIDFFDYSNIKGRAGRLMEHYVGKIINLKRPPQKELINVDIPLVDQNPIDSEILVNLEEDDVKEINDNKLRYSTFKSLDPELQNILKRNSISIEGQINILQQLDRDIKTLTGYQLIHWNQADRMLYKHVGYILDLCWENLSTDEERRSFAPKNWVQNKIVSCCYGKTIGEIIENDINYQLRQLSEQKSYPFSSMLDICKKFPTESQAIIDTTIERVFAFQKNWLQYRAPKWLNVVDSLQKYLCKKYNMESGDYAYIAEMIENSFVEPSLRILLEYGLPENAITPIRKLAQIKKLDLKNLNEDELLAFLKNNLDVCNDIMGIYELEILEHIL